MKFIRSNKGITLIALAVTIIVLLILAGITLIIANELIIDKVITASTKTIEASLQEKVEMALADVETGYWVELKKNPEIDKQEYFEREFPKSLQNLEDVKDIAITGKIENTRLITFKYKDKTFTFNVSKEGKVNFLVLLKGNVKVGDYVEYPMEYEDVYSEKLYTSENSWRVIDDGKMKGTSGQVRLISTGVPAKWYYNFLEYENAKIAVDRLINDFENLDLLDSLDGKLMKGKELKDETLADKITTLTLSDFNYDYNEIHKTNRKPNDISKIESIHELFFLEKSYYWLATNHAEDDKSIYFVSKQEIKSDNDLRAGVRPVICLKENLMGTFESGRWKIVK